jgi:hypothetical protein
MRQQQDCERLIAKLKAYLGGQESERLAVLEAIAARSAEIFEQAFAALLRGRELEIAANIQRGELEEPHVMADRNVFIEGLAILKLADRLGIPTADEYQFCPSIARQPMTKPMPEE